MSRRTSVVVVVGLLVALALAGVVSGWASGSPDGLERVATDTGMDTQARESDVETALSGYQTEGIEDDRWSTGVAGVAGVAVTFAVFGGVTLLLRRRTPVADRSE